MRTLIRVDAVFDFLAGLLLLLAPWDALWRALDLPRAQPELWAQLAGGLLIGFAYLLWLAPRSSQLLPPVALTGAVANAVGVVLIVAWLASGDLDVGSLGESLLAAFAALLAVFAVGEGYVASRSVAMLMPRD